MDVWSYKPFYMYLKPAKLGKTSNWLPTSVPEYFMCYELYCVLVTFSNHQYCHLGINMLH